MAALEGIDKSYVSRLLPLAFLSPDIVQAIVRGVQPAHLTAKTLIQRIVLPLDWLAQRERVSTSLEAPSTGWHGWAILTPETADREMVK